MAGLRWAPSEEKPPCSRQRAGSSRGKHKDTGGWLLLWCLYLDLHPPVMNDLHAGPDGLGGCNNPDGLGGDSGPDGLGGDGGPDGLGSDGPHSLGGDGSPDGLGGEGSDGLGGDGLDEQGFIFSMCVTPPPSCPKKSYCTFAYF